MADETQTAYAKSAWSDPANIFNFLVIALQLPEISKVIPERYVPLELAVVALANLALRTLFVTHPVANIAPGAVKPVEVKKLEATQPGTEDSHKLPQAVQDKTAVPPPTMPAQPAAPGEPTTPEEPKP